VIWVDDGKDGAADAMGSIDGGILDNGILGSSSGASFMRQIRGVAQGPATLEPVSEESIASHIPSILRRLRGDREQKNDLNAAHFSLPPRKAADRLMQKYWDYSHVIFPFLDRLQITKDYVAIWTGNEDPSVDNQVLHCTLNLVFAIACQFDATEKPSKQPDSSSMYFARSRALLSFDLLDVNYFPLVQALLLTTIYLQSTNMPQQCFQSISTAIWIAQAIGLHLPQTTCSIADAHDRELARRVWHGCILMDR
jgi:hypothetical protein